jgi:transmembrane sensor
MRDSTRSSWPDDIVDEAAAAWVLRCDRGLTASEQDDYLSWLAADPRHGVALARHRRNWQRLNLLALWRPEHARRPNRDLLAPLDAAPAPVRSENWRQTLWLPLAVALAVLVALNTVVERWVQPRPMPVGDVASYTTEQRVLPDGSRVELNHGAEVEIFFNESVRRVRLERGEAHFKVSPEPGRPFRVEAGSVRVEAVGTAFSVLYGESAVEVLVTEGRVRVGEMRASQPRWRHAPAGDGQLVLAGQSAWIGLRAGDPMQVREVPYAEMVQRLAWQPRLLDSTTIPLQRVVDDLNAQSGGSPRVVVDEELGGMEISAALRWQEMEEFLQLLETRFLVKVERADGEIRLKRGTSARLVPIIRRE